MCLFCATGLSLAGKDAEPLVLTCGELSSCACSSLGPSLRARAIAPSLRGRALGPSLCACVVENTLGFRGAGVGFFAGLGGMAGGGVDSFSVMKDGELQESPPGEEEEGHTSDAV